MNQGKLQAQIYSTASSRHRTFTNGGVVRAPEPLEFRSTSIYTPQKRKKIYATAPMHVANGSVKTIASSVNGGVLTNSNTTGGGYIPPGDQSQGAVIAGVPDTPLGDGWDVAVLLMILCVGYGVYLKRKVQHKAIEDKK